jgi:hypothetical protein
MSKASLPGFMDKNRGFLWLIDSCIYGLTTSGLMAEVNLRSKQNSTMIEAWAVMMDVMT